MNRKAIEEGMTLILQGIGVNETDHNFHRTPERYANVLYELFQPPELSAPVFDEDYADWVVLRRHVFYTLCPHHMLPVRITASVAYIPNGKVIGASKLARVMHDANRCPMTQEALTNDVLENLNELTENTSDGAAIHMIGEHGCFRIRGVRTDADMVTLKFAGSFEHNSDLQRRFLQLVT